MELERSLLCLQQPASGPYPEEDESTPNSSPTISQTFFLYDPAQLRLGLTSGLFLPVISTKITYAFSPLLYML
jgi:hypothetical protein